MKKMILIALFCILLMPAVGFCSTGWEISGVSYNSDDHTNLVYWRNIEDGSMVVYMFSSSFVFQGSTGLGLVNPYPVRSGDLPLYSFFIGGLTGLAFSLAAGRLF
jgi:hypothetical protein